MLNSFGPRRPIFLSQDYYCFFFTLDLDVSDLDQLTEIMKITGTPTQEFISKLQSQDVRLLIFHSVALWRIKPFVLTEKCQLIYFRLKTTFRRCPSLGRGIFRFWCQTQTLKVQALSRNGQFTSILYLSDIRCSMWSSMYLLISPKQCFNLASIIGDIVSCF